MNGVQTVSRAFELLDLIADHGSSVTISELSTTSGLPLPTVHRLLKALVALGHVRQTPSRRYALGPRLIRLGEVASQTLGATAKPFLTELVNFTEETSNFAIREGDLVVYVAQVPSRHSMRMFTEIGRRVLPHCTGVGKALLAQLPDSSVKEILQRNGMPAMTTQTITTADELMKDLERIRQRGWAEDNGEQEIGVRCIAAPVLGTGIQAAISVSGPSARLTPEVAESVGPYLLKVAAELATAINSTGD
ncbi:allantoin degradation transcriptional regulator AllR [Microlunatus panaciterrae]|uniref:IclR family acetate operon transcriptional repressor n=1 Tax=Microlunatus panaciterrae TaxID=400768 RepID=A0ABS2RIY8_9ACTN|nr:IclR family transcriptional regulator [Microlunatus panaciterrae]MBM7798975.1 IclR family acetate operon transcriptional repressor [Microlunatus panaciterrae]